MKKILSVLLIILLLIVPVKTFAATDTPSEISDTSFDVVSENENANARAAADGIVSGYIYNIKNVNSGKYLNVHNGVDADGTNVYQWTKDGSVEQNFKIIYTPSTDSYTFYAMCSSNGNFRALNIHIQRGVEPLASGQNVNLWDPDAAYTQQFILVPLGQNQYRIATKHNNWLFLTVNDLSNGSSGGTAPTSPGNIYLCDYVESFTQHWIFEPVGAAPTAEPRGYIESIDASGISGWVWSNGLPDTSLDIHIYIEDGLGAQYFYVTTANIYRQDLYNCGYGNGYHGFFFPVNWKEFIPKPYTITIFAIGGSNPPLVNAPWSFTVRQCQGAVTEITSNQINGWVYRPDAPNYSIDTHIYIRNASGQDLAILPATANIYREDLVGYGTGNYGFSINVDWSTFPEEQLYLTAYALDGTGFNTTYWTGTYNNYQRPINLVGVTDEYGNKFYTTYIDPMTTWCQNIGCSTTNIYTEMNFATTKEYVQQAHYCVLFSHGDPTLGLEWRTNSGNSGLIQPSSLDYLDNNYFSDTKCLLLMSCYSGIGGATGTNMVNAFYNKGANVVIGFQTSIFFSYYNTVGASNYRHLVVDKGAPSWARQFTQSLGEGKTVQTATLEALNTATQIPGSGTTDDGTPIPADYGLGSVYIAGNANKIIKH